MKPEQRIASRVVTRFNLKLPIDVEWLANQIADVEIDDLPVHSDAVVITSDSGQRRPLIILNHNTSVNRKRFTLAHEIGHLLIPWHMGTFMCHLDWQIRLGDELYKITEVESNRFASELLLPTEWMTGVAKSGMSLGQMLKFVRSAAQVSTTAATFALFKILPPGYLFALTNSSGFVDHSMTSPNSILEAPNRGEFLDESAYSKRAFSHEVLQTPNGGELHLWKYGRRQPKEFENDNRKSSEILSAIVSSLVFTPAQAKFYSQSINGIIGAANSSRKPKTAEELSNILHEAFATRPKLVHLTSHPDFDTFLHNRSEEIFRRQGQ